MKTRVYRQPAGMSATGPLFFFTADGYPPVVAQDAFDACRQLMRQGVNGEVEIVTSTGTVSMRGPIEALAGRRVEEGQKLRIRSWSPPDEMGGRTVHRTPPADTLGPGADEAESASVSNPATGAGHSSDRMRLESDADQWVLIIGSRRHYCRSRIGLERNLGKDHPLLDGLPAWHHELAHPATAEGSNLFEQKDRCGSPASSGGKCLRTKQVQGAESSGNG